MKSLLALFLIGVTTAAAPAADPVDFARDVRPILAEHCFRCHAAKLQKSGLRADTAAALLKGGASGPAVTAGKSGESLLMEAITGGPNAEKMPPEGNKPLSAEQIATIKTWIDQGAKVPEGETEEPAVAGDKSKHWSFQPVARPELPAVKNEAWARNPIDQFILARLEQQGLNPSPEADKATLIRRLSFDLLGLPPNVAEVDAFLDDDKPDAYERLVERLLASPHYGERWGRHWLDLARYADSHGFTIDGPRSIWKYRDWVIDALNRDLPFDRFTIEQLAGDMLPNATPEQLTATGFHRNTLLNQEGGTDAEQFRVEAVVDRVNTTGSVFLGLTVGCAQCHTHKYDPISHREYYQFYAFLNNADEPNVLAPTAEQSQELSLLRTKLAAAEKSLAAHDAEFAPRQAAWEEQLASREGTVWTVLDPTTFVSKGGAMINKLEDKSLLVGGDIPGNDTYVIDADTAVSGITAVRLEVLQHDALPKRGPGLSENGNFVLSEVTLAATPLGDAQAKSQPMVIASAVADAAEKAFPAEHAFDNNPKTGWSPPVKAGEPNVDRAVVLITKEDIGGDDGTHLSLSLSFQHEIVRFSFGRVQISVTNAAREAIALEERVRGLLSVPAAKRSKQQRDQLTAEFRKTLPTRMPLAVAVDKLKQQERKLVGGITTTMVMRERPQPRESYVQVRGDFLRKGVKVTPNVLAVLPPLPADVQQPNRLDLAKWLVSPENPLTPRVTVNRVWQKYFGVGLVETENDFGTQGTPPTHPELLDWLSSEFVAGGWSMKALHRLIVASATYRQSSAARSDLQQVDPRNKLLARQSRVRLEAETIRDACLAASGLLSRKIGGPGVYPPQPAGIYAFTQQDKQWKESTGEDRYRRGMYIYFWRSSPYPFLMTFDAPGGNVSCTRRIQSNTPLQALTLANDGAFFEIAQGLARTVLLENHSHDAARLESAFRRCLGREPSPRELNRLADYLHVQQQSFAAKPEEAKSAAPVGLPATIQPSEAAAWTAVARVLLNLDEFITRE